MKKRTVTGFGSIVNIHSVGDELSPEAVKDLIRQIEMRGEYWPGVRYDHGIMLTSTPPPFGPPDWRRHPIGWLRYWRRRYWVRFCTWANRMDWI